MIDQVTLGLIIISAIIGLMVIYRRLKAYKQQKSFANDYLDKLNAFLKSNGTDKITYEWLIHRSSKMQNEMGIFGILAKFRPPYGTYFIDNYEIISNLLPEIRKEIDYSRALGDNRALIQYSNHLNESIIRFIGSIDDEIDSEKKHLSNPIVWLREGIKQLILLPFILLSWIGFYSNDVTSSIKRSFIIRIFASIITLIGILSGIITILIGWEQFVDQLNSIF